KIVIAIDTVDQFEKKAAEFKEKTGFVLQLKRENGQYSQADGQREIFQAKTISNRMENNQAMAEARKWANDRGITIYKTSIKQNNDTPLMEVHFISPEIAKRHDIDLEELSYRIGMPVTYAKSPKQNEII